MVRRRWVSGRNQGALLQSKVLMMEAARLNHCIDECTVDNFTFCHTYISALGRTSQYAAVKGHVRGMVAVKFVHLYHEIFQDRSLPNIPTSGNTDF